MSAYDQLLKKLDDFIRKYYKNQLLKGLIYAVALGITLFLAVSAAEYFGRFSTPVRTVLFFGFSAALVFILGRYIFLPLSKLFKLGKTISHAQAAEIVGTHFTEVKDKLLNTLQLKKLADENSGNEMLQAAIDQKTAELRPVPFVNAVNLGENKKYLKYAALPSGIFVFILFAAPSVITDGTKRVVNYGKEFKPEAPFSFSLDHSLTAVENEDFPIEVSLGGEEIPQNVYVEYEGARFRMNPGGKTRFSHTVKKVSKSFTFKLFADGFYSDPYTVNVVPKPTLAGLKIKLEYPAYLNKPAEVLTGTGDMTVPEGTRVQWTMSTRNTDELVLVLRDTSVRLKTQENKVLFTQKVKNTFPYAITGRNRFMDHGDTNRYLITVIPDEYPSIAVEETRDSLYRTQYYFRGEVSDDYGFRGLSFHYKKQKPGAPDNGKDAGYTVKPLALGSGQNRQPFLHAFNFAETNPEPGDEIVYFFTVYDNDGVNGSKAARTAKRVFRVPTEEELAQEDQKSSESIKNSLSESMRDAEKIRKEASELNKSLLQKKTMDWQDRKKVEELLKKQRELEKQIENLKKENEQKNQLKNEFQKPSEEELQKQQEMEKLLDELMNDELKKMLDDLQKLLQEQDKNKLQEQLKNMQFNSEDLKKQLERTLELYKQMEFDQKLEQTIDKLEKLAQEQKNQSQETAKESPKDQQKQEQLQQKQEELNKKFDDVRKDLEDLQKKNEALENKREELKDTKPQEQDIKQEQQKAGEQMQSGQNKKASQNQQNAGEKMEQMAQEMKQMQQEMEQNQQSEDLEALRQILDNLMRLSFDQEDLMETIRKTNPSSPKYKELAQQQRKLKDDSKIIEDSLFALSKRVPEIKATVNQEIADIKRNMDDAVQNLSDRETPQALVRQQYTMTSVNNLALMLSEAIENAQQQMQMQKKQGNKACSKPGHGRPSEGEMKKLQEAQKKLSEQMHKMAQQMQGKQGQTPKPGEQKQPGEQGQNGEMSKDFAKMAAEQEMIRKQMQEMYEKLGDSKQRKMMQDIMNKMEENETDLYNKRINQQTMMRQKDIEIKMLESEKALREQEMDEQRESKEGNTPALNAEQYKQYLRLKEKQTELLRTVPPALKPYYKQKVSEYFNKL